MASVVEYQTKDQVLTLQPLLKDYIDFVCADLEQFSGVSFDPEILLNNTLSSLEKVIPPSGRTLAALDDASVTQGMVFLRRSTDTAMEIKRLYVSPKCRGGGIGFQLLERAIELAKENGASSLRLDTTANLRSAIKMYESFGFKERPPYQESDHFNDPQLMPYLLFMQLDLEAWNRRDVDRFSS